MCNKSNGYKACKRYFKNHSLNGVGECEICGKRGQRAKSRQDDSGLSVHHILPKSIFRNNKKETLIILCKQCHDKADLNNILVLKQAYKDKIIKHNPNCNKRSMFSAYSDNEKELLFDLFIKRFTEVFNISRQFYVI